MVLILFVDQITLRTLSGLFPRFALILNHSSDQRLTRLRKSPTVRNPWGTSDSLLTPSSKTLTSITATMLHNRHESISLHNIAGKTHLHLQDLTEIISPKYFLYLVSFKNSSVSSLVLSLGVTGSKFCTVSSTVGEYVGHSWTKMGSGCSVKHQTFLKEIPDNML